MDYLTLLLLLPFVWICIYVLTSGGRNSSHAKLPPGPHPFPIIGNIHKLGNKPHQALANLSKTYGPLMTLKLGRITTIVISSPSIAKEALHKHDQPLSSRTIPDSGRVIDHHKMSMVWGPTTAYWKNLRKICAVHIFATQRLDAGQGLRRKKVQELLNYVQESCKIGQAVDIGLAAFTTALNLISNTLFSIDLAHYNSNSSREFNELVLGLMEETGRPNVADYFPVLRFIDPQGVRRRTEMYVKKIIHVFDNIINERIKISDSSMATKLSNDVLDILLKLAKENNSGLSLLDVKHLLLDLFVAGIDTTTSTVEWAMAELLRNPEKMEKAQTELKEVLGKDGQVEESDISKFSYLQAIVKETFRLHPPGPFLVPRKAETNVDLCDFTIPKNAQVLVNVWAIGRDSITWPNPNSFVPERFIGQEIDVKGKDFELIPFGAGRRICPELSLGQRMVHLILASLVHSFDWKLPNGLKAENMDMSETFGLTLHKAEPLMVVPIKA